LQAEVGQTGAKTEKPVQVDLPKNPKTNNAGATTLQGLKKLADQGETKELGAKEPETLPAVLEKETRDEEQPRHAGFHFSLQIGSYPALQDAKNRIEEVAKTGLKPFMREAEVEGRGRWYRVYVGEYPTKSAADKAGQKYRLEHLIDSFIVAKVGP